jgi:hypothetical protein
VHVSASFAIFEPKVFNFEFASQDIAYYNLVFTLNESGHGKLYERQSLNAFFLLLELLFPRWAVDLRSYSFSILILHHAVLIESLSRNCLSNVLELLVFEVRKLGIRVFVHPSSLH